ncbi:hypothetical protein AB0L75_40440 [Streptomyces sp. NPDC052101]|uniref:hypothetical protein n=1 Tax=Streptomyces sp. NPDC052101 TaxID=3155763 RepID=UPI0034419C4F
MELGQDCGCEAVQGRPGRGGLQSGERGPPAFPDRAQLVPINLGCAATTTSTDSVV